MRVEVGSDAALAGAYFDGALSEVVALDEYACEAALDGVHV